MIEDSLARAAELRGRGQLDEAASVLDTAARQNRGRVLPILRRDTSTLLQATEHGITFRYIPKGSFVMGSADGDADEAPPHEVSLPDYWLSDVPLSWSACAQVLGWPNHQTTRPRSRSRNLGAPSADPRRFHRHSTTSPTCRSASSTARMTLSTLATGTLTIRRAVGCRLEKKSHRKRCSGLRSALQQILTGTTRSRWLLSTGSSPISSPDG